MDVCLWMDVTLSNAFSLNCIIFMENAELDSALV